MGWVLPLHRCPHVKMGVGREVFRLSVWTGACKHDHGQPPCSSAPLQSLPAVASRRLPCGSRRGRWRHARGKSASDSSGGGCASGCGSWPPRRCSRRVPEGWGPERAPGLGSRGPDRSSGGRERSQVPPKRPRAHHPARGRGGLRASSRELRRPGTRGCTGGACLASGRTAEAGRQRAVVGRSRGRRSRDPLGARPSVAATRGWRLVFGRAGPEDAFRGDTDRGRGHHERHAAGHPTTPSWGSFPFGEYSTGDRSVSVCLTDTVRPQGFSPSRRFDPARALWVYFTPHPPIGFRSSELFPRGQPLRLSAPDALVPLG